jgi:hypothetical protein
MPTSPTHDVPTSLDDNVRLARAIVARMRGQFGDREDFNFMIMRALAEMLADTGYDRKTIAFTLRAMFDC